MNKTAVIIQHIAFEGLGNLAPALEQAGYHLSVLNAASDDLSLAYDADLLVILGGPIGVYDNAAYPFLDDELQLLQHAITHKTPIIGICLGAQLIAHALGADVYAGKTRGLPKEIGFAPLHADNTSLDANVLAPVLEASLPVLHWHGDTFDLPDNAVLLASSAHYPNQAFSYNDHILALQFHIEVTASDFESWLVGHTGEIHHMGLSVNDLRDDCNRYAEQLQHAAHDIWTAWLTQINRMP